ncbi:MAG: GTP-binding protein [Flavobacteriaceae bacterium]|nr:GTP-binding protein [Flavobacteriaceae bacterium]
MDLLRFNTAGSVDDGKSTLIGRLLYDSEALTIEQQELIVAKTKEKGMQDLDFSVLTDGLIAEREQGITIDVAHIYFASDKRKFIIADTPGHVEYTRNMVTGASNSDASVILIDVRKGLLEQSHRHFYISQLLRLPVVVFCVNKMDLVHYAEEVFLDIAVQIQKMCEQAEFKPEIHIVPISSLKGDNVVHLSENMKWYKGKSLLDYLEGISIQEQEDVFRMDVQQVLHVQNEEYPDFRAYAGRIASGKLELGALICALPGGQKARVVEIRKHKTLLEQANKGESVMVRLDTDIDASRGTLFVNEKDQPKEDKAAMASIVCLQDKPMNLGSTYVLQTGSRKTLVKIDRILSIIDPVNPQKRMSSAVLNLNDIAEVELHFAAAAFMDTYANNKNNGVFILIDRQRNETVAVGFVR